MRRTAIHIIITFSSALAGCGLFQEEIRHEHVDEGTFCIQGRQTAEGGHAYDENTPFQIRYRIDQCLSSSCSHDRFAGCTVERDGVAIVIRANASWTERGTSCTADCGYLEATCELDGLTQGQYTVSLGGRSLVLEIPSVVDAPLCLERT